MKLTFLLLLGSVSLSCGYHILCVFPVPSHSHNQLGKGIVDALLKAGHTVTWITPFPEKVGKNVPKTLKVFDMSEVQKHMTDTNLDAAQSHNKALGFSFVKEFANNITKTVLTNSAFVDMLVKVQFDAVVTEYFFNDVLAGIAAVQQVPWITLSGTQLNPMLESQVDEVRSISTVPLLFNDASIPMTLIERAVNAFIFTTITYSTCIAAVQQVPWITLSGTQLNPMLESQVDEVRSISTVPLLFNDASIPMTLIERAVNAFIFTTITYSTWLGQSETEALYEQIFSPIASARNIPLPPFKDAYYNVSILFVNSHEALSPSFSVPPNVIQIAGYHIDENPPPLPKDLQDLLDNSKNGVVYFSMGSVLRSAALKPHTRKALLAKFAALPYTVLWKFEKEIDEKLPPNVHIRPWMPQASILKHPNVKVFITHGGQLSTLEAVQAGVPLLAIPVFGDQPSNAEQAVKAGFALRVTFDPNMAEEVDVKLKQILKNPTYTERAKYLSKLFRGRPVSPSKLVSHYVELAIETKGAYHLRSVSLRYSWVERWMVDVALLALTAVGFCLALLALAIAYCYRKFCGKATYKGEKNDLKGKKKN